MPFPYSLMPTITVLHIKIKYVYEFRSIRHRNCIKKAGDIDFLLHIWYGRRELNSKKAEGERRKAEDEI
jgi:hypothetical protein